VLPCIQERVSADPDDPEIQKLRCQLQLLGAAPSRQALSHQQEMELWNWAEQEVAAGRVSSLWVAVVLMLSRRMPYTWTWPLLCGGFSVTKML